VLWRLGGGMKALKLDFFDQIDAKETILFEARPNPFLYGLEASRAPIVAMFGLSAFVVAALMITKGGPFLFLLKVVLLLDFIFFSVFFLAVVLIACRLSFVLTNQNVVIRGVARSSAYVSMKSKACQFAATGLSMAAFISNDTEML
jgi:hypothetical protein